MKRILNLPLALLLSYAALACTRKSTETEPSPGIQEGTIPPPESVLNTPLSEAAPPREEKTNCADPNVPDEDKISAKCPETGVGRTNPIPPLPQDTTPPGP